MKPDSLDLRIDKQAFAARANDSAWRNGLPAHIEFCLQYSISNQRPSTSIEFRHNVETKKKTIRFQNGTCDACLMAERKAREIDLIRRITDVLTTPVVASGAAQAEAGP